MTMRLLDLKVLLLTKRDDMVCIIFDFFWTMMTEVPHQLFSGWSFCGPNYIVYL